MQTGITKKQKKLQSLKMIYKLFDVCAGRYKKDKRNLRTIALHGFYLCCGSGYFYRPHAII